jgi:release factor glutamine methyltransferase
MSEGNANVAALLRDARTRLAGDDAGREAELLLCHVLERPRSWLFAHDDAIPGAAQASQFRSLVDARVSGQPIAHLLGRRGFWTLDLEVGPATLIPRPETERLVEIALALIPAAIPARIADLGTGSGAIALAIASERPQAQVVAVDASDAALQVAARNVTRLGMRNVELRSGDWFAPLAGERFAVIVSNPPYIANQDPHLDQGDLRFEPRSALASGVDGLDDIRRIAVAAPAHLHPGGWLLVEHGWEQGAAVRGLFEHAGLLEVSSYCDIEGRERVTGGRRVG